MPVKRTLKAQPTGDGLPDHQIQLQVLDEEEILVAIEGVTPVIPHKWSAKALNLIEEKHREGSRQARRREPQDPEKEALDACYWLPTGDGQLVPAMPATAFKAAMVGACRFFSEPSMTVAKLLFYVKGMEDPETRTELVPLQGDTVMRQDTPRNATGVVDLRYRYQIGMPWEAVIRVRFIPSYISGASIVALLDAAGRGGVGDWRPSSPKSATGTFGQWRVKS